VETLAPTPHRGLRRRWSRRVLLFGALLLLVVYRLTQTPPEQPAGELLDDPPREGIYRVLRVVDGDTLLLQAADSHAADDIDSPRAFRLRLLGIDCPESVRPEHPVEPWGPESTEFTRQFLQGDEVRLRFDKRRLDRFDRYLAYVFVGERMLNEELVRVGLARVSVFPGDSETIARQLRKAEQHARSERLGIWSQAE
jgi:micrococcal nuclease